MVQGQRRLSERLLAKDHHSDPVARPFLDEVRCHLLDRREAVGLLPVEGEVKGMHAPRGVDRQDDVDPFGQDLHLLPAGLGASQGKNQKY